MNIWNCESIDNVPTSKKPVRTIGIDVIAIRSSGIVEDHHHTIKLYFGRTLNGWQIGLVNGLFLPTWTEGRLHGRTHGRVLGRVAKSVSTAG
ncbi:Chloride channel CLC-c -like protein [Gossypium arboreum]|uniref:Chloride channel CLC-c-like protein n=1 Tax=Gossypium arboreum TaxID=29729 RepID=A0A0B0P7C1_GOSAR|nr:Chloride channel CLC-c -like protein [Gossypium arboreum]